MSTLLVEDMSHAQQRPTPKKPCDDPPTLTVASAWHCTCPSLVHSPRVYATVAVRVIGYDGCRSQDLMKADVVLTTYAIVENEHRKAYAGDKVACPDCGRT